MTTLSNQQELKFRECPFCGSDQINTEITICNAKVFCMVCSANFIRSNGRNDQENLNRCLSIWNHRPLEDAKDQRIANLEEALREARENLLSLHLMISKTDPVAWHLYHDSFLKKETREIISTIDALLGDTEGK